ncbi:RagB/SusD family nutrient uptake outer membrane protein [Sinomicrobium oceani]|nr:RagB/SusD family nutrient uptake outer membrane protein [Sinomicrobium oceani]
MMKIQIHKIAAVMLLAGLFSCDDYLDTTPTDRISDLVIWENEKNVQLYVNGFYPYIDRYGQFGGAQFNGSLTEGLTDTFKYGSYVPGSKAGDANRYVFTPEVIGPTSNLLDVWSETYERIRRVNEFLVGLEQYSVFDEETNDLYRGQARFFRAFLYFQLAKRHDGVILYTDMNLQKDKPLSTAAETWDLIADDLDFAASVLPEAGAWPASETGRVTKGAAWALKSRAMLYAERWQEAKDAADEVINSPHYALTDNYEDSWKGGNSESILEYNYLLNDPNHSFDKDYATYGEIENQGGSGTPTQEMVESYENKSGMTVNWAPWHGNTSVVPPYEDLDPRFHATIIYPGSEWQGKTMTNSVEGENGRYMAYREQTYAQGRTTTGYYLKKLRDPENTDLITIPSTQAWVEIRLAEVYLNRAEANYRLGKSDDAMADINAVRSRPGIAMPAKTGLTGANLFEAIRKERKVELAYEGHLYWDMRRWKLAHTAYQNYRVHGFRVTGIPGALNFEYVDADLEDRIFLQRTYILPIPYNELANNSAIEQYDPWK